MTGYLWEMAREPEFATALWVLGLTWAWGLGTGLLLPPLVRAVKRRIPLGG